MVHKREVRKQVKYVSQKSLAGLQYLGLPGVSASCLDAIVRLIQFGDKIHNAKLLTCVGEHSNTHCFLLAINYDELVAVKTGFSSGYRGEGPAALSSALQLLERHGAELEEYEVSAEIIDRVAQSCLTRKDIDSIEASRPYRPTRWYEYFIDQNESVSPFEQKEYLNKDNEALLRQFPKVMPFGIIDSRLYDLTLSFEQQPDSSIMSGYRRLEDIVRERTGLSESNTKLFAKAFQGEEAILYWGDIDDPGEQTGRASLFTAIFMAFRNRRAHREPDPYAGGSLQEFLLLNQLYLLEKEAIKRIPDGLLDTVAIGLARR